MCVPRSVGWRPQGSSSGDDRKKYASLGRKLPFMKSRDEVGENDTNNTTNDAESLTSKEEEFVPTYEIVQQVNKFKEFVPTYEIVQQVEQIKRVRAHLIASAAVRANLKSSCPPTR